jgi:hypothetical protein
LLSSLYALIGFAGSATIGATLFIVHYNELHNPEYPSQDIDWPVNLAFIEIGLALAALISGVIVFQASGKLNSITMCQLWIAIAFLGTCIVGHSGIAIIRAYMMGLFGSGLGTCADIGTLTGCPTTRWEATKSQPIQFNTPYLPECTFWFWDSMHSYASMVKQIELVNDTTAKSHISAAAQVTRQYMDWSERSSYGWRIDDTDVNRMLDSAGVSPDTTNNMDRLMAIQEQYDGSPTSYVQISDSLTSKPSLSHCWYWGCHPVCTDERYMINMWWIGTSSVLALINVLILVIVICLRNEKSEKKDEPDVESPEDPDEDTPAEDTEDPDAIEFIPAPYMKRRQRFPNAKKKRIKLVF